MFRHNNSVLLRKWCIYSSGLLRTRLLFNTEQQQELCKVCSDIFRHFPTCYYNLVTSLLPIPTKLGNAALAQSD